LSTHRTRRARPRGSGDVIQQQVDLASWRIPSLNLALTSGKRSMAGLRLGSSRRFSRSRRQPDRRRWRLLSNQRPRAQRQLYHPAIAITISTASTSICCHFRSRRITIAAMVRLPHMLTADHNPLPWRAYAMLAVDHNPLPGVDCGRAEPSAHSLAADHNPPPWHACIARSGSQIRCCGRAERAWHLLLAADHNPPRGADCVRASVHGYLLLTADHNRCCGRTVVAPSVHGAVAHGG